LWQGLKKGEKGLCIIAGDIYPIDVISHIPVLCEERDISYIYVPSKQELGEYACRAGAVTNDGCHWLARLKGENRLRSDSFLVK